LSWTLPAHSLVGMTSPTSPATLGAAGAIAARTRLMPVLFIAVFMAALDTAVVGPTIPTLRQAFGVDNRAVALVTTVFVLCSLASTALMANLSDRHGRRPVFLTCVSIFALGSLLVAVSPSFGLIIASRAIQGIGAGGITPTASAVIGDVFPAEERGKALGLIGATFGMAFVFGPPLAGLLMVIANWHWIFLVNLPIAAYVLWLGARVLPARTAPASGATSAAFDLAGIVTVVVLLVLLVLGITRIADQFAGRALWPWCLGGAAIALAAFVAIERRAERPVIPMSLFANRQLAITYTLTTGAGFGMGAVVFLATVATLAYGVDAKRAGFVLLPLVVASMIGAAGGGRMMNKLGPRTLMIGGFLFLALGYAGTAFMGAGLWMFLAASLPVGLGVGIVVGGSLRSIAIDEAPLDVRAAAQGVINIGTAIGTLTSAAAVSALADFAGGGAAGFARAYSVVAVLMAGMLLITLLLRPTRIAMSGVEPST
jgi:MFS family permease